MTEGIVPHFLEKVWGKSNLTPWFAKPSCSPPVGEVVFASPRGECADLLAKFLFTSQPLSVQVHPNDILARQDGHRSGKDEAWIILDAEPDASIALGLRERVSAEYFTQAVESGAVEALLGRRAVKAGDAIYVPAGTIHAIGAGITLLEIQQNVDVTYRLYDYARPRELHVEQGIRAATLAPFRDGYIPMRLGPRRTIVAEGPAFAIERWAGPDQGWVNVPAQKPVMAIPLGGQSLLDGQAAGPGTVWEATQPMKVELGDGSILLLAYPRPAAARTANTLN